MTLFGRILGPEEIFALVGLLMSLVFWIFVLKRERNWANWFRTWEAERKSRRDAELAAEQPPRDRTGPWG